MSQQLHNGKPFMKYLIKTKNSNDANPICVFLSHSALSTVLGNYRRIEAQASRWSDMGGSVLYSSNDSTNSLFSVQVLEPQKSCTFKHKTHSMRVVMKDRKTCPDKVVKVFHSFTTC